MDVVVGTLTIVVVGVSVEPASLPLACELVDGVEAFEDGVDVAVLAPFK
ncbi:hypothetical protein [Secundilactobacillus similis]|nr:hypothetical protein [Secundilactobacillus similis]